MRLIDELLARQAIDVKLAAEELGILTEITGRGRDRIYVVKEVIDLIQR